MWTVTSRQQAAIEKKLYPTSASSTTTAADQQFILTTSLRRKLDRPSLSARMLRSLLMSAIVAAGYEIAAISMWTKSIAPSIAGTKTTTTKWPRSSTASTVTKHSARRRRKR